MTKKTKLLLTSFATIAMSASLMVGGTYALFTSETQVNVGVQAGTVEIKATVADNVLTKSRVGWGEWSATPVTTGTTIFSAFENGGGATFTENSVNLELMTPGDQVQFTIDLDNKSNVNAMYRTVVLPTEDTGLLKGLEITFADVTTTEAEKAEKETFIGAAVADWAQLPENTSDVERKILVTITLPKDAGNEYQNKTAKLVYYVEAIQGNADVNDGNVVDAQGYTLIQSATDLWRLSAQYANPNKVSVLSTTQALPKYRLAANIDLNGAPFMPIGTESNPFLGEFDGNGYTVSNFTVTGNESVGLFGYADGGNQKLTVKNLTVKDATINGSHWVGGIVGKLSGSLENCTVENVTITAVPLNNMNGDKVGGIVGWTSRGEVKGCMAKNVTVAGYRDVGGLVGAAVADNWVKVTGNTVDGATLSLVEGYQAFDENGVYEEQKNIAPVVGRIVGSAVVENNSTLDATTPTQIFAGKQAALEAALAADYAEIEIGASFAMEKTMDVAAGKSVTFNMNGYTISNSNINNYGELYLVDGALEGCGTDYALYNKDGGVLTIDNVDISNDGNGVVRFDGGEAVINSGNFTMANGNQKHVLRVGSDATVTVNSGTFENNTVEYGSILYVMDSSSVTVNGGTFTTASKAYMIDNNSEITVNNGEFNGYYIRTQASGNTVIKGGTFNVQPTDEMMTKDPAVYRVYPNGQMAVYGGTFKVSPQEFVGEAYQVVQNADGTYTVKMKQLGEITSGETVEVAGDITLKDVWTGATNKEISFKGAGESPEDTVIDLGDTVFGASGSDIAMENVTINRGNANYKGFHESDSETYTDCIINGTYWAYGDKVVFTDCVFNQTDADAYNVWTYGATEIEFNNCTFNSAGKSVLIYNEGYTGTKATFNKCTFNASQPAAGKAAIEIDSSLLGNKKFEVFVNNCTSNGFDKGNVSGNTLWNEKKNSPRATVIVDGQVVYGTGVVSVANAADFQSLATKVANGEITEDTVVYLCGDVDLTSVAWTPIGAGVRNSSSVAAGTKAFAGTFDGNGYTIKLGNFATAGVNDAVGLFGVVTGTVKNVVVEGNITTASENAGLVAGLVVGGTIDNCVSVGSIQAPDGVGGIVGRVLKEGTIKNCVNYANVTSGEGAGGVVGKAYYTEVGKEMYITNCVNYGTVAATYAAGGIAGLTAAHISGCVNYGNVSGAKMCAGIVAQQTNYGSIKNCENTVDIAANGESWSMAAGIVGWVTYQTSSYEANQTIVISGNKNSGSMTNADHAGGIAALVHNQATITNNTNTGAKIEAKIFAGGIVGAGRLENGNLYLDNAIVSITGNYYSANTQVSTTNGANCWNEVAHDNDSAGRQIVVENNTEI